jgi:hypothetical protein
VNEGGCTSALLVEVGDGVGRLDRRPKPFLLFPKLGGHRLKIRGFENLANFDLGLAAGKRIRAALEAATKTPLLIRTTRRSLSLFESPA